MIRKLPGEGPREQRPTFEQGGASREHYVREKRAPQVHVRLLDGKHQHLMDALTLLTDQVWPEQKLRCPESGRTNLQVEGKLQRLGQGLKSLWEWGWKRPILVTRWL